MERAMRDEILAARRRLMEAEVRLELMMSNPTNAVSQPQLLPGRWSYDHRQQEAIEKEMIRQEIIKAEVWREHAIGCDRGRLSFTRPPGLIPRDTMAEIINASGTHHHREAEVGRELAIGCDRGRLSFTRPPGLIPQDTMAETINASGTHHHLEAEVGREVAIGCDRCHLSFTRPAGLIPQDTMAGQKHHVEKSISASKKKAESPPPHKMVNAKKAKTGWSCAICQIDSTSEQALNDHLQGRKHKAKEATSRSKAVSPPLGNEIVNTEKPKDWSCAICRINSNSQKALTSHLRGRKHKANEAAAAGDGKIPTFENSKVRKRNFRGYRYWCDVCNMGAYNIHIFLKHKKGIRHIGRTGGSRFERCDRIRYTRDLLIQLREVVVQVPEDVLKVKQEVEAEFCGENDASNCAAQELDLINSISDELKRKMNSLLEEYFNVTILDEALQCVEELRSPAYHPEVVREAILVGLEKSPPRVEPVLNLLTGMFGEKVINANDTRMGCLAYAESLEDLPKAPESFGEIVGGLALAGVLDFKVVSEILAKVRDDFYGKVVLNGAMKVVGSGPGAKDVLESQADDVKACGSLF